MKYENLKSYIKSILQEDFGFERHRDDGSNELNQTSDNGNNAYDTKLYKYYEIKDYSDYNKFRDTETFYTVFSIKGEHRKKVSTEDSNITIKTFNDIGSHELKRRNLITSLYQKLKI